MKKTTAQLYESIGSSKTYSEYLGKESDEMIFSSVSEYLNILLNEKKLKKGDVIRDGNLSRDYAYQIFSGRKTNPTRNKILMIAFGMHLSAEETRKLLKISGLSDLYPRNPRDCAILIALQNRQSILEINELLSDHKLDILE